MAKKISLTISKEELSVIIEALMKLEDSDRSEIIYNDKGISCYGLAETFDIIYDNN